MQPMMLTFKLQLISTDSKKRPRKLTRIINITFIINEAKSILKFGSSRGISFLISLEIKSDSSYTDTNFSEKLLGHLDTNTLKRY